MDDGVDFILGEVDLEVDRLIRESADTDNLFSRSGTSDDSPEPTANNANDPTASSSLAVAASTLLPQEASLSSAVDDEHHNAHEDYDDDDGDGDIQFSHHLQKDGIDRELNTDLVSQFNVLKMQIGEYKTRYLQMIEKNKATYKSLAGAKSANNDLEEQIMDLKFQLNQAEEAATDSNAKNNAGMFRRRRGGCCIATLLHC
jgi:hypothetical protein